MYLVFTRIPLCVHVRLLYPTRHSNNTKVKSNSEQVDNQCIKNLFTELEVEGEYCFVNSFFCFLTFIYIIKNWNLKKTNCTHLCANQIVHYLLACFLDFIHFLGFALFGFFFCLIIPLNLWKEFACFSFSLTHNFEQRTQQEIFFLKDVWFTHYSKFMQIYDLPTNLCKLCYHNSLSIQNGLFVTDGEQIFQICNSLFPFVSLTLFSSWPHSSFLTFF